MFLFKLSYANKYFIFSFAVYILQIPQSEFRIFIDTNLLKKW